MRRVPEWATQLAWAVCGVFATGAVWYFLSLKEYASAAYAAVGALVCAGVAIYLHRLNDRALSSLRTPDSARPTADNQPLLASRSGPVVHRETEAVQASAKSHVSAAPAPQDAVPKHYRATSLSIKKEEIRQAYKAICDRVANRFDLKSWAPLNHLTRLVDTNLGDMDAFARAERELPGSALVAVRILVAFETARERPMYMSYVFIGRTGDGDEVVATFTETGDWSIISRSSSSGADHEELLASIASRELQRLSEKIQPDIRKLR
jgi:hypothetical protein